MNFELKIQFGKSSSIYYREAVNLASKLKKFTPMHDDKPNVIVVNQITIAHDSEYIEALWYLLRRWNSTKLFINGEFKAGIDAQKTMMSLLCFCQYQKAIVQPLHCRLETQLAGWGCKLLNCIELHTSRCLSYRREQIYWYHCGHFITDDVWKVDRDEITAILKREVKIKCLSLCPAFRWETVLQKIANLPDEINLSQDNQWEKHFLQEPGCEPELIGVKPKVEPVGEFKPFSEW